MSLEGTKRGRNEEDWSKDRQVKCRGGRETAQHQKKEKKKSSTQPSGDPNILPKYFFFKI